MRRVLITAPYFLPVLDEYRELFASHGLEPIAVPVVQALREADLLPLMADVEAMICGDDEITARVLAAAPRLRVIAKWGTGIDAIDRAAAAERGIAVRNTPGAFDDPVADTVLGYMLSFARGLPWLDRDVKAGSWRKRPGVSLAESTVGVIGCGNIGRAVARRAVAFGATVLGSDHAPAALEAAERDGVVTAELDAVLQESDFVSIHLTLDNDSYHAIGERELRLMKPTAVLVNTARGPLVDETALAAALRDGTIAGAGLDVFEEEPLPEDSPLRALDNCLLAPHNANASPAAWRRVHESTLRQLLKELALTE